MKQLLLIASFATALSACATDGYYGGGGLGVAYYDNAYGPYYDGYWQRDRYYYRTHRHGRYLRDDGHHFLRDRAEGFREYRGRRGRPWR